MRFRFCRRFIDLAAKCPNGTFRYAHSRFQFVEPVIVSKRFAFYGVLALLEIGPIALQRCDNGAVVNELRFMRRHLDSALDVRQLEVFQSLSHIAHGVHEHVEVAVHLDGAWAFFQIVYEIL
jgi:hypothetical protein